MRCAEARVQPWSSSSLIRAARASWRREYRRRPPGVRSGPDRPRSTGRPLAGRLVQAVLDHQAGGLRDDATLLLVQWTGP